MELKKIYNCLTITAILGQLTVFPITSFAEKALKTTNQTENNVQHKQKKREEFKTGLIGQYFTDDQFKDIAFVQVGEKNRLVSKEIVKADTSHVQSMRWVGTIKPSETGNYTFSTSKNESVIMQVNGETVVKRNEEKKTIHLEKNKLYELKLEQRIEKGKSEELQFLWSKDQGKEVPIPEHQILSPNFRGNAEVTDNPKALLPTYSLFEPQTQAEQQKRSIPSSIPDMDGDTIPDVLEENGYTFKDNAIVPWNDAYVAEGYKKYTSSPRKARTAADPYTDFEKVTGNMPEATNYETRDPLVAAYPSVSVGMEKIHFSPNQIETEGNSGSKTTSVTETNSTINEVSVGGKLGVNDKGFSFEISPSYKHSWTKSTVIQNSETASWSKQIAVNPSTAAYLNANIRYYNEGTAPIYDLAPTSNFVLQNEKKSIGTITANKNTISNSLAPGKTYPAKGQAPIFINQANEAGTVKIEINGETLDKIQDGRDMIDIETTQNRGKYEIINESGRPVPGGEWDSIRTNIDAVSGEITLNLGIGKGNLDRRIAAKDSRDPEDKTPELTVKEAIKKAFDAREENGRLVYTDADKQKIVLDESVLNIVLDENTKKEVEAQLVNIQDKKIGNVKWKRGMKMTLHVPAKYFDFEKDGEFYSTYTESGGYTGRRRARINSGMSGYSEENLQLKPYTSYTARTYVKSDSVNGLKDFVFYVDNKQGNGQGAKVNGKVNGEKWELVEIAFNTGPNPEYFSHVGIRNNGNTQLHFDDVAVTEWKQTENIEKTHEVNDWTTFCDRSTGTQRVSNVKFSKFPDQKVRYQLHFNDNTVGFILPDSSVIDKDGVRTVTIGTGSGAPATNNKFSIFAVDEKNENLKVKVAEFGENELEKLLIEEHKVASWWRPQGYSRAYNTIGLQKLPDNLYNQIDYYKIRVNGKDIHLVPKPTPEPNVGQIMFDLYRPNGSAGYPIKDASVELWAVVKGKDIKVLYVWTP